MPKETPFTRRKKQREILDALKESTSEDDFYRKIVDVGASTGNPNISRNALRTSAKDKVARYFPGKTLRELMDQDDLLAQRIQGLLYQFMDTETKAIPRDKFEQMQYAIGMILKTGAAGGLQQAPAVPTTQNNFLVNLIKDANKSGRSERTTITIDPERSE